MMRMRNDYQDEDDEDDEKEDDWVGLSRGVT